MSSHDISHVLSDLPGLLAVIFIFGGGVLVAIIHTIMKNWRKVRVAEQQAALKQSMVERGLGAADIERILAAGKPPVEE